MVTSVKNQGSCGSCYAFSAISAVESAYLMKNKKKYKSIDLSEQQMVDCTTSLGNNGCNGGWMPLIFDYEIKYGSAT